MDPTAADSERLPNVGQPRNEPLLADCAICLSPIESLAVLESCRHAFCYQCIASWTEQSARCPLCNTTSRSLLKKRGPTDLTGVLPAADAASTAAASSVVALTAVARSSTAAAGVEIAVSVASFVSEPLSAVGAALPPLPVGNLPHVSSAPDAEWCSFPICPTELKPSLDMSEELMCLDHTQLMSDVLRLLASAEASRRSLLEATRSRKASSAADSRMLVAVEAARERLEEYRLLFLSDRRFEPVAVLHELYNLESTLKSSHARPNSLSQTYWVEAPQPVRRYSANDYDVDSDDDDDDGYSHYQYSRENARSARGRRGGGGGSNMQQQSGHSKKGGSNNNRRR